MCPLPHEYVGWAAAGTKDRDEARWNLDGADDSDSGELSEGARA